MTIFGLFCLLFFGLMAGYVLGHDRGKTDGWNACYHHYRYLIREGSHDEH